MWQGKVVGKGMEYTTEFGGEGIDGRGWVQMVKLVKRVSPRPWIKWMIMNSGVQQGKLLLAKVSSIVESQELGVLGVWLVLDGRILV